MSIGTVIDAQLTVLTTGYITAYSGKLCAALTPIAVVGTTIYLFFQGWAIARGHSNDTLPTLLIRAFRIAFIAAVALAAGTYNDLLVGAVTALQNGLIESLTAQPNMGAFLDGVWIPYRDLITKTVTTATTPTIPLFGMLGVALLLLLAGLATLIITLGYYALCKLALALLFGVGPIFILMAMWPSTQRFAESWLSQALNYVFLSVLSVAASGMVTQFGAGHLKNLQANPDATNLLTATLALDIGVLALLVLMLNLNNIATALTGGIGLQGVGREIAALTMRMLGNPVTGRRTAGGGSITGQPPAPALLMAPGANAITQNSPAYAYQQAMRQASQRR